MVIILYFYQNQTYKPLLLLLSLLPLNSKVWFSCINICEYVCVNTYMYIYILIYIFAYMYASCNQKPMLGGLPLWFVVFPSRWLSCWRGCVSSFLFLWQVPEGTLTKGEGLLELPVWEVPAAIHRSHWCWTLVRQHIIVVTCLRQNRFPHHGG